MARSAARLQRGAAYRGGGALLAALRLEAEARAPAAPGPLRTAGALYAALDAAPHSKVRAVLTGGRPERRRSVRN